MDRRAVDRMGSRVVNEYERRRVTLARGSIAYLDNAVEQTIDYERMATISVDEVRGALARRWLARERPRRLFARIAWAWRLLRAVWR